MPKLFSGSFKFAFAFFVLLPLQAICSDNENEIIPSDEYLQCLQELKSFNVNLPQRLIFCHSSVSELSKKLKAFRECSDKLIPRLGNRTGEVCVAEYENLTLLKSENLKCLDKTLQTTSPDFITNVSSKFLNEFIKLIPEECHSQAGAQSGRIKLHSTYTFATGERFGEFELGGLSGAAYNPRTNVLSTVSDQRGLKKNLIFNFNIKLGTDSVQMTKDNVLLLRPHESGNFFDVDMEGIVLDNNENFIISAEASYGSRKSFIHSFSDSGSLLEYVPVPAKYSGIRTNKGFEGLGLSPDGKKLFTANEAALFQDQIPGRRVVRLLSFAQETSGFTPEKEYLYEIEDTLDNGLVEILALSQDELLILERGYNARFHKVTARLFKVSLKNAKDVISNTSIKDLTAELDQLILEKELVIDMDEVTPYFPAGLRRLDNLEGMTLGPLTDEGKQTLILVSDNNMSSTQVTQFVILEI